MTSGPPSRLYAWVFLARKYAELLLKLPFVGIWYISKSNRQCPNWSWSRAITVYVVNFSWEIPYRTGRLLTRDINRAVPAGECMGTKFLWVEPVPENLIQGEIKNYAEAAQVKPCRIPAYGFGDWGQEKLLHAREGEKIVMHCHGGGYVLSVIDALSGYHYLINTLGFEPQNIIIAGDSAGGNLVLALTRYLRDNPQGLPLPGGLLLVSPWCDLGETHFKKHPGGLGAKNHNRGSDMLSGDWTSSYSTIKYGVRSLLGNHLSPADARYNPYISAGSLDLDEQVVATMFENFPPTYLVYGDAEIFVDEDRTLYERMAKSMGNRVVKDEVADAIHDFFAIEIWEPEFSQAHKRFASWLSTLP